MPVPDLTGHAVAAQLAHAAALQRYQRELLRDMTEQGEIGQREARQLLEYLAGVPADPNASYVFTNETPPEYRTSSSSRVTTLPTQAEITRKAQQAYLGEQSVTLDADAYFGRNKLKSTLKGQGQTRPYPADALKVGKLSDSRNWKPRGFAKLERRVAEIRGE